jgi:hypothetical protein
MDGCYEDQSVRLSSDRGQAPVIVRARERVRFGAGKGPPESQITPIRQVRGFTPAYHQHGAREFRLLRG